MGTLFDDHAPPFAAQKTIRILVYPNITYAKDLTKDSYVIYLTNAIRQLNRLRDDLFFYLLMPEPSSHKASYNLPLSLPACRVR